MPKFLLRQEMGRPAAVALLVTAAVMWSMGGLLIKLVAWHPVAIAGIRSAIAALLFLSVLRRPRFVWSMPQVGGAIAYAATVIFFVVATKMTTAANAILLQYTAPVYVALLSAWLLKERPNPADWVVLLFVIAGIILFFLDELAPGDRLGNMFAILSGISFAALVLCLRKQKNGSTLESIFFGNLLTAFVSLPFISAPWPDFTGWAGLVLLGIFQLGVPYLLYAAAIRHVTALEAILVPVIEPVLNPLWVFLFIGEVPGPWAMAGGTVVFLFVTARCVLPVRGSGCVQ